MTLQKQIGSRLRAIREALAYKRPEVEQQSGIKRRKIEALEIGEGTTDMVAIAQLCEFYDVSLDSLVTYSNEQFKALIDDLSGVIYDNPDLELHLSRLKVHYIW